MSIKEIESAIQELSAKEVGVLSVWLADYQASMWEARIAGDVEAGRLDEVLAQFHGEYTGGMATAFSSDIC